MIYLGLALGAVVGGLVGFLLGRYVQAGARVQRDEAKVEIVDATADAQRDALAADLRTKTEAAQSMPAGELKHALDDAFTAAPGRPVSPADSVREPAGKPSGT